MNIIKSILNSTYYFILFVILYGHVFYLSYLPNTNKYACVLSFIVCTICFCITLLRKTKSRIIDVVSALESRISNLSFKNTILSLSLLFIILRIVAIFILRTDSTELYDPNAYLCTANELATTGYATTHANYCHDFNHVYWFSWFLTPAILIFGYSYISANIYLIAINLVSFILITKTIAYQHKKTTAIAFFAISTVLPSSILLNTTISHEHALLFFISIAIYLEWGIDKSRFKHICRFICTTLAICCMVLSSMVNGAGLIVIISYIIISIKRILENNSSKTYSLMTRIRNIFFQSITILIWIASSFIIITSAGKIIEKYHSNFDTLRPSVDKVIWTLYEGCNYDTGGTFSDIDAEEYRVSTPYSYDAKTCKEWHLNLLKKRYNELLISPEKIVSLIHVKNVTINGGFYFTIRLLKNHSGKSLLSLTAVNLISAISYFIEFFFWFLLTCIVTTMPKKINELPVETYNFTTFSSLYITGTILLLQLTEVQNKYVMVINIFFNFIIIMFLFRNSKSSIN